MSERDCLAYYNQLREAHRYISVLDTSGLPERLQNAITAVDSVLYLAEGEFVNYPHRGQQG